MDDSPTTLSAHPIKAPNALETPSKAEHKQPSRVVPDTDLVINIDGALSYYMQRRKKNILLHVDLTAHITTTVATSGTYENAYLLPTTKGKYICNKDTPHREY